LAGNDPVGVGNRTIRGQGRRPRFFHPRMLPANRRGDVVWVAAEDDQIVWEASSEGALSSPTEL
jgi:hypothetical protein